MKQIDGVQEEYATALMELTPDSGDQREQEVRRRLTSALAAQSPLQEVRCEHGVADIITDTEVIEVKVASKYAHALGQVQAYATSFPGRRMRVHLFGTGEELTDALLVRATTLLRQHDVLLTYEVIDNSDVSDESQSVRSSANIVTSLSTHKAQLENTSMTCLRLSENKTIGYFDATALGSAVELRSRSQANFIRRSIKRVVGAFQDSHPHVSTEMLIKKSTQAHPQCLHPCLLEALVHELYANGRAYVHQDDVAWIKARAPSLPSS